MRTTVEITMNAASSTVSDVLIGLAKGRDEQRRTQHTCSAVGQHWWSISLIYHSYITSTLIWLYEPDTDLIQTSYSVSGTVSPSYSVSYDHTLSVTCLSDPPCSTSAAGASRWCLTLAARTLARCTHARRQRPRALVLGLARAAQDGQATRATVEVDEACRGEGGRVARVLDAAGRQ